MTDFRCQYWCQKVFYLQVKHFILDGWWSLVVKLRIKEATLKGSIRVGRFLKGRVIIIFCCLKNLCLFATLLNIIIIISIMIIITTLMVIPILAFLVVSPSLEQSLQLEPLLLETIFLYSFFRILIREDPLLIRGTMCGASHCQTFPHRPNPNPFS